MAGASRLVSRAIEVALDVQEPPEPSVLHHAADLLQRRLKAPVEGHCEDSTGHHGVSLKAGRTSHASEPAHDWEDRHRALSRLPA
jgi:hypothetical protein